MGLLHKEMVCRRREVLSVLSYICKTRPERTKDREMGPKIVGPRPSLSPRSDPRSGDLETE